MTGMLESRSETSPRVVPEGDARLPNASIERRAPAHVKVIVERLQAGDASMARFVGLPTERFTGVPITDIDEQTRRAVEPLVRRAGLVAAFNDAWLFIGGVVALSLLLLPFLRRPQRLVGPASF